MNPGSLVNHRRTSSVKFTSTQPSAKLIFPSFLYSSLITWYASMSLLLFDPHPKDFFKLKAKVKDSKAINEVNELRERFFFFLLTVIWLI